jgi:hypothetical protein
MRKEIELLKDHADLQANLPDRFSVGPCRGNTIHRMKRRPIDLDLSFLEIFEAIDTPEEGAFAAPRRPDTDDRLSLGDIEIEPAEELLTAE